WSLSRLGLRCGHAHMSLLNCAGIVGRLRPVALYDRSSFWPRTRRPAHLCGGSRRGHRDSPGGMLRPGTSRLTHQPRHRSARRINPIEAPFGVRQLALALLLERPVWFAPLVTHMRPLERIAEA